MESFPTPYSLASKAHKTSLSRNTLLSLSNRGFSAISKYAAYIKVAGVFCFDKDVSVLVKLSPMPLLWQSVFKATPWAFAGGLNSVTTVEVSLELC